MKVSFTMEYQAILFLAIIGFSWQEESVSYDDFDLISLRPFTEDQFEAARKVIEPGKNVQIMKSARTVNDTFDLLVHKVMVGYFQDFANTVGLDIKYIKRSYGQYLKDTEPTPRRRSMRQFSVYHYNSYPSMQDFIDATVKKYQKVTTQNLGNSFQGRPMRLVKISKNPEAKNPIIFIDAGIHAREWVAPAMALYLIHRLSRDPEAIKYDLQDVDWYILPVVNPDGYEYTRASKNNRLWRKTRSKSPGYDCYGVDGNRNYGFRWGLSGVSNNPCDRETYAGPEPFSEPETKMVKNILMDNKDRIKVYVSIHSYGQYLVYPWGYTGDSLPKEWKKLDTLARKVSNGVQEAGGKPFRVMSAGKWYPAAGGSDDFAYGAAGVPYSYTMELTEGHDFQFPEKLLSKVLPQFYGGFRVFAAQIRREFGVHARFGENETAEHK